MSETRAQYDEEFKKNAVRLSYGSPKSVRRAAEALGVAESILYLWCKKYTPESNKTSQANLEEEIMVLKLENAELKMECDMLKKAAYFAKLQK